MKKVLMISLLTLSMFAVQTGFAQNGTTNVHLFQSFLYDAPIAATPYVEGGLNYDSYDGASSIFIGAQGGYGLNEKIEIGARLGYQSWSFDGADGQSGITDITAVGRYNLVNSASPTKISAGAMITLPIGSEDIMQGNMHFGGFGALRHKLESGMELTANLGLILLEMTTFEFNQQTLQVEEKTSRESSFAIGAGVIYPLKDKMSIVGEFRTQSEVEYTALSCGINYQMGKGCVRGALVLGLSDGAPDIAIIGGYLVTL
ncbi:MAG: hypothetical protein ABIL68_11240 [bacterium]